MQTNKADGQFVQRALVAPLKWSDNGARQNCASPCYARHLPLRPKPIRSSGGTNTRNTVTAKHCPLSAEFCVTLGIHVRKLLLEVRNHLICARISMHVTCVPKHINIRPPRPPFVVNFLPTINTSQANSTVDTRHCANAASIAT